MFKMAAASVISSAWASGPQPGCYGIQISGEMFSAQAQVEIKRSSTLDFSVTLTLGDTPAKKTTCPNEAYTFDAAASTITVGQSGSSCLQKLSDSVGGIVKIPVSITYNAAQDRLETNIVIDIVMPRLAACVSSPNDNTSTLATTTAAPTTNGIAYPAHKGNSGNGVGSLAITTGIVLTSTLLALM